MVFSLEVIELETDGLYFLGDKIHCFFGELLTFFLETKK